MLLLNYSFQLFWGLRAEGVGRVVCTSQLLHLILANTATGVVVLSSRYDEEPLSLGLGGTSVELVRLG
nr:hypothetical protein CFP56_69961 [Quercus suber]